MNAANKVKALGVALGLALFIAAGLIAFVAAESKPLGPSMKEGLIDPAVVAPAEQLGRAFTMVANHVKPAVVSVYSEKTITFTQPGFSFPFGNDFLRRFFGGQLPQQAPNQRQYRERAAWNGVRHDPRQERPHPHQLPRCEGRG